MTPRKTVIGGDPETILIFIRNSVLRLFVSMHSLFDKWLGVIPLHPPLRKGDIFSSLS